ncbi:unnamed protein product [Debaryomyces tyrocola]|nr:unnamed protein product [Debaryomyces tyrocola]
MLKLVDYRNRELMDGCLTKREIFPWNKEAEVKIQQYLEYGNISPENLVYKSTGGSNEIDKAALVKMVRECEFRFSQTNGCYIKGHCHQCWGRSSHEKRDPKCRKGRIAKILIHSYYERLLLQMYFLERGLTFRLPTVCHAVDLMVYCSRESAPLFIDYVLWLLSRYERMVIA